MQSFPSLETLRLFLRRPGQQPKSLEKHETLRYRARHVYLKGMSHGHKRKGRVSTRFLPRPYSRKPGASSNLSEKVRLSLCEGLLGSPRTMALQKAEMVLKKA
jgi:hypothetical protein